VTAKRAIVDKLLRQLNVTGPSAKLLLLLAERDRMAVLGDLVAAYRERLMEYRRIVRAEVTTAAPLAPERLVELEQRLAAATGRRVTMTARVDPSLIGGAITRVGSVVYDSSIATQLEKIRETLEDRR
jgi:F-type H+-transporting ATPase subunit delta